MPSNNHALIRYRTIDRCLKNIERGPYHLKDLIDECSDAVNAYDELLGRNSSKPKTISRRTILYDLEFMKDDKIGFNAPIESDKIDGYYYSNPKFEIFKANIRKSDLDALEEALELLNGINAKSKFERLETIISRIRETFRIKGNRKAKRHLVQEYVENPDGERWLSKVSQAIKQKCCLNIDYEPFDRDAYQRIISPLQIKEYNNRWFLIAFDHKVHLVSSLGMDRIKKIEDSIQDYNEIPHEDFEVFSKDIIGISLPKDSKKIKIHFRAYGIQRHYINTKPIHLSQKCLKMSDAYGDFSIEVIPNYELQSKIISYGKTLEIKRPKYYREEIKALIFDLSKLYK